MVGHYGEFPTVQVLSEIFTSPLPTASRISDITGTGKLSPIVTSLSFLKSTTILHFFLPDASVFLGITRMGEFQGLELGTMIPLSSICSVCFWTSSLCILGILKTLYLSLASDL